MRAWMLLPLALLLPCTGAVADEPPVPSAAEKAALVRSLLGAMMEAQRLAGEMRWEQAAERWRAALDLSTRIHGPAHRMTIDVETGLGAVLIALGRLDDARAHLERSLAALRGLGQERSFGAAKVLHALGTLHASSGRFEEAEQSFARTIEAFEGALAGSLPASVRAQVTTQLAGALGSRANALFHLGRKPEALEDSLKSVELCERAVGEEHLETAMARTRLAVMRIDLGEPEEALVQLDRALPVLESRFGPASGAVSEALGSRAVALLDLGRFEEARVVLQRAATGLASGTAWHQAAGFLARHARSLSRLGELAAALAAQERALGIYEATYGPEHPDTLLCMGNLAGMLVFNGQVEAGARLLRRALEAAERRLGPEDPLVIWLLQELGGTLTQRGESAEAIRAYDRALGALDSAAIDDPRRRAFLASGLANVLGSIGRHDQALALQERALADIERAAGPGHPDTVVFLSSQARTLRDLGRRDEASALLDRAVAAATGAFGDLHPDAILALGARAALAAVSGRVDAAHADFGRSLEATERLLRRDLLALAGPERLALARSARSALVAFEEHAPAMGVDGYAELLRFKGLVSRLERSERAAARRADAQVGPLRERARIDARRVAALAQRVPPPRDVAAREAWQGEYAAALQAQVESSRALAAALSAPGGSGDAERLEPASLRATLPPDALLVDLLRAEERYLAWVVSPTRGVARLDLGGAQAIDEAARAFAEAAARALDAKDADLAAAGAALRGVLLDPLAAWLRDRPARLILVPDGALAAVPFAALPGRDPTRCLLDEHGVELVAMAQDVRAGPARPTPRDAALLVGDVDFGAAGPAAPDAAAGEAAASAPRAPSSPRRTWRPLAGTAVEIDDLRRRLGDRAQVLRGAQATEEAFAAAASGRWLVHAATHGYASSGGGSMPAGAAPGSGRPWLGGVAEARMLVGDARALSGLVLAGVNRPREAGPDDGYLSALEASHLALEGCDLLVLSACDTALGRVEAGEGVIGLVQAFQEAGARDVVASLWRVDDRATALLMQRFYDGVLRPEKPLGTAAALREAALWLRNAKPEGRDFSAPRYWAAFVAYERR